MGLEEELEKVWGGGNNGRHGTKVEREQGAIFFGEFDEGVVEKRVVQKVQVPYEWKTWLRSRRVREVPKCLRFCCWCGTQVDQKSYHQ